MSLDGYIADEHGNFDWTEPDEEVHAFISNLERLVGRRPRGRVDPARRGRAHVSRGLVSISGHRGDASPRASALHRLELAEVHPPHHVEQLDTRTSRLHGGQRLPGCKVFWPGQVNDEVIERRPDDIDCVDAVLARRVAGPSADPDRPQRWPGCPGWG